MNTFFNASHDNFEGKRDKIVKDLEGLVVDAGSMLSEVANFTTDEFATARSKFDGKLDEAKSRLNVARIVVAKKAREAVDDTQEYVTENPWKALGVVAAAGVLVYAFFSRR